MRHQLFDNCKLLGNTFIILKPNTKTRGNHRQLTQTPTFPFHKVIFWIFQFTEMTKGPSYLITISLKITVHTVCCAQYLGDVTCDTGFLCDTNNHIICF
ncbi:hypothetical protein EVA_22001 [gut metagenome]|uniref:Uncharacterized protein n=1 Tax=gut metagenome TaxID=749906 RepID=J9BQM3_9ZZZZ